MRDWLKQIRAEKSMTQMQVAEAAGISGNYYCYIETGERGNPLPVPTAKKIAEVLNFDWQRFYEEGEESTDTNFA